ncbi:uncharacterized protein SPSK_10080 [Sporothrix schenckii 1099-18]|uniref:Uncharacterized protein n=1 Tax=Sporothrix schenckii 1099-18 TaxID=1397361 RepID=A0A0F2M3C2_SPOSC|nr:uncharacterized protein SPSK_10080 [Sporothrix schenckii 1099-18]KJR84213.1 hypothetical protein SPSK_10080 [Sporothrix schenckii 1099-18]
MTDDRQRHMSRPGVRCASCCQPWPARLPVDTWEEETTDRRQGSGWHMSCLATHVYLAQDAGGVGKGEIRVDMTDSRESIVS